MDRPSLDVLARRTLATVNRTCTIWNLRALEQRLGVSVSRLPFSIRVLLENLLRWLDGWSVTEDDVEALARWSPFAASAREIAFRPARVLLQDFTGVPVLVDLVALREAVAERGGDPAAVNPRLPVDLVIDHSVQVDRFGAADALAVNARLELERNRERFTFLRWAQQAFRGVRVVPPATGIVRRPSSNTTGTAGSCRTSSAICWEPDLRELPRRGSAPFRTGRSTFPRGGGALLPLLSS